MSMYVNGRRTAPVIGVGQGTPIEIDEELSNVSENPVQNKVITEKFEQFEESVNDRFESLGSEVDEHFETLEQSIEDRFEELGSELDERFAEVYDTIDTLENNVNEHFEQVEESIQDLDDRKVNKVDFLTLLDAYELWYGVESSEDSSEDEPVVVINVIDVPETLIEDTDFTVDGNVLTLTTDKVCKVGFEDVDGYTAIEAIDNGDGTHSFNIPDGVSTVYVVRKGDVNLDGGITAQDADLLTRYIHGESVTIEPLGLFAGDTNNSGDVADSDAFVISAVVYGLLEFDW